MIRQRLARVGLIGRTVQRWLALAVGIATAACDDPSSVGEDDLVARGREVFARCEACHTVQGNDRRAGPSLEGVMGRTAGTAEGFRFSEPMRTSAIIWNETSLAQFLHDPRRVVPGNRMFFAGLRRDEDIAALIAYLQVATSGPGPD